MVSSTCFLITVFKPPLFFTGFALEAHLSTDKVNNSIRPKYQVILSAKYQVKAYVTLNTLVFDHELFDSDTLRAGSGSAIDALRIVSEAKVDALIVQDIGLALASCAYA